MKKINLLIVPFAATSILTACGGGGGGGDQAKELVIDNLAADYSQTGVFKDIEITTENTDDYIKGEKDLIKVDISYEGAEPLLPGAHEVYDGGEWAVSISHKNDKYDVLLDEAHAFTFTIGKIPVVLTATFGASTDDYKIDDPNIKSEMVEGIIEGVEFDNPEIEMEVPTTLSDGIYDVESLGITASIPDSEYYKLAEKNNITLAIYSETFEIDEILAGKTITVPKGETKVGVVYPQVAKGAYSVSPYDIVSIENAILIGDDKKDNKIYFNPKAGEPRYIVIEGTGEPKTIKLTNVDKGDDIFTINGLTLTNAGSRFFLVKETREYNFTVTSTPSTPTFELYGAKGVIATKPAVVLLEANTYYSLTVSDVSGECTFRLYKNNK
ncbi:MAG: hypothetical protein MJ206_02430 [Bacilli bacterium]|nr:hypothetical protein [Bacilli bacterium]